MIAKTFKGLEEVLAGEITALGGNDIEIGRRAVSFTGDKGLLYRANLWLRTASRVLVPIATFRANDADEVYAEVKKIDWEQYMDLTTTFSIDATVYSETFKHSRYVTYKVKDAIADLFNEKYGKRPSVRITDPDLYINVHIAAETVTISLDSSGESLHKRGWRVAQTDAPINEALAAGMLLMAGWQGQSDLYDPMCGSGTLLIEAALIALNIPPGIFRKHFAFENWKDFNKDLFATISEDDSDEREFTHHIYGSDAGFYAVQAAMKNIRSAGVQRYVDIKQIRIEELKGEKLKEEGFDSNGALVIINPPYGERLAQDKDVLRLYSDMGKALKFQFTGATAWVISSNEEALKCIGLKPSKKIHLLNGELDCLYNQYELFQGEHKEWKKTAPQKDKRPQPNTAVQSKKHYDRKPHTDSRVRLSSTRREDRQVPARTKRPQQTARVPRRDSKRG
jgi:putative N6-adenine-specific DNA methylase